MKFPKYEKVLTFGETMGLFSASSVGSLAHVSSANIGIGGAESNVAIGLSRLNTPVTWMGRVGTDSIGRRVEREIRAEGVDTRAIAVPGFSTGMMIKEFASHNRMTVNYYRGNSAGSTLSGTDIPEALLSSSTIVHLTGITPLLSAEASAACRDIVERAKQAGAAISVDINYRSALGSVDEAASKISPLVSSADIVFGSAEELAVVCPETQQEPRLLAKFLDPECNKVIVVKEGADGATGFFFGEEVKSFGYQVDVVDPVGAGDSFVAGFLKGYIDGNSPEHILDLANKCGAITCSGPGDWESAPFAEEIERFQQAATEPVQR